MDRRIVVNAILWILRTGAPWRDLPAELGKKSTVHDLFTAWSRNGLLDEILHRLQGAWVDGEMIDLDLWCLDGTVVRAARCAAGAKKGVCIAS